MQSAGPLVDFTANLLGPPRVLVVEDDDSIRAVYAEYLSIAGCKVEQANDGDAAIALVRREKFDVILSDIDMPGMDGLALLKLIKQWDVSIPVVLVTGNPGVESAVEAIESGVFRYLLKPVDQSTLVGTVNRATKLNRLVALQREVVDHVGGEGKRLEDHRILSETLDRGIDSIWMAYQPIVSTDENRVFAYEALTRTREPRISSPLDLFATAEKLGRVHETSRAIRRAISHSVSSLPNGVDLFVNLHPKDIFDEELYSVNSALAPYAQRIVLEVTERTALEEGTGLAERIRRLRALGYRIAVDDLGAGFSGLNYLALLKPEIVKLDMSLVRSVHTDQVKQKLVASMSLLCFDLGMLVIAEGVEERAECETIQNLGCALMQGYLFSKPGPAFPSVTWRNEVTAA